MDRNQVTSLSLDTRIPAGMTAYIVRLYLIYSGQHITAMNKNSKCMT